MYVITDWSKQQAKKLGVELRPSSNPKKKIDVYKGGKKLASIGDINYQDYGMYLQTKGKAYADERRRLYRIRHKGENNFSLKILW
jgi:Mn-dependent DtxR family transcriptional regulator